MRTLNCEQCFATLSTDFQNVGALKINCAAIYERFKKLLLFTIKRKTLKVNKKKVQSKIKTFSEYSCTIFT